MFDGPLEDRVLIRERYGAYSDAVFQRDCDAWLACWTEDGVWDIFDKEICGKPALRQQWDETWSMLERMAFFSEVGSIEVEGERAAVRSYCLEIVALQGGESLKVVAHYADELAKVDGEWLFSRRQYAILIRE
jgi:ketosteroid isomerase-like protein